MTTSDRHLVDDALTLCDFTGLVYLNWLAKVGPEILESTKLASIREAIQVEILAGGKQPAKAV